MRMIVNTVFIIMLIVLAFIIIGKLAYHFDENGDHVDSLNITKYRRYTFT